MNEAEFKHLLNQVSPAHSAVLDKILELSDVDQQNISKSELLAFFNQITDRMNHEYVERLKQ